MAITVYPKAKKKFQDGDIDLLVDTIVVLLLRGAAAYDANDEFISDVIAGSVEVQGGIGYSRQTLASKTTTVVGTDSIFDADDPLFPAMTNGAANIVSAIVAKNTGFDATSPVICWYDGGTSPNDLPHTTDGGTLTVVWPSTGILKNA